VGFGDERNVRGGFAFGMTAAFFVGISACAPAPVQSDETPVLPMESDETLLLLTQEGSLLLDVRHVEILANGQRRQQRQHLGAGALEASGTLADAQLTKVKKLLRYDFNGIPPANPDEAKPLDPMTRRICTSTKGELECVSWIDPGGKPVTDRDRKLAKLWAALLEATRTRQVFELRAQ
jgi:hypothetical protein